MNINQRKKALDHLHSQIKLCPLCRLSLTRKLAVPGEGVLDPEFMVIGQGPGANEDLTGRPFFGRAGKLLTELLALAGIDRQTQTFITSAVKCLPTPPLNRKPKPDEIAACNPYLRRQIELVNPKKIILVGDVAFKLFFPKEDFSANRGQWLKKDGRDFFISYHPAAGIRFQKFKKILESDFKILRL